MIEPFTISIPDEVLDDLRRRIRATRWPPHSQGLSWNYGFDADYLRDLAHSWAEEFDWRAVERRMNAFSHFSAQIQGIPIHFIREKGKGPAPLPLILSHGWPWTFWDMQKVIRPLADPAAFGGNESDAFDVIVPSLPGFAFSTPLPRVGIGPDVMADLWDQLMTGELGFPRYAAAGGDWGTHVTTRLGHAHANHLAGIHLVTPMSLDMFAGERPWDITAAVLPYDAPKAIRDAALPALRKIVSHVAVQTIEPQTLAFAMHDSPVGMLAWLVQRRRDWGNTHGDVESAFPREHLLATATLYWVTESFASAARIYGEEMRSPWQPHHNRSPRVEAPTGITFFESEMPEVLRSPDAVATFRASAMAAEYNLHHVFAHPEGGHFAHYENPDEVVADIRATFRDLRTPRN